MKWIFIVALALLSYTTSILAQQPLPFDPPVGVEPARTMQASTYAPKQPVNHLPKDAQNILIITPVGRGQVLRRINP